MDDGRERHRKNKRNKSQTEEIVPGTNFGFKYKTVRRCLVEEFTYCDKNQEELGTQRSVLKDIINEVFDTNGQGNSNSEESEDEDEEKDLPKRRRKLHKKPGITGLPHPDNMFQKQRKETPSKSKKQNNSVNDIISLVRSKQRMLYGDSPDPLSMLGRCQADKEGSNKPRFFNSTCTSAMGTAAAGPSMYPEHQLLGASVCRPKSSYVNLSHSLNNSVKPNLSLDMGAVRNGEPENRNVRSHIFPTMQSAEFQEFSNILNSEPNKYIGNVSYYDQSTLPEEINTEIRHPVADNIIFKQNTSGVNFFDQQPFDTMYNNQNANYFEDDYYQVTKPKGPYENSFDSGVQNQSFVTGEYNDEHMLNETNFLQRDNSFEYPQQHQDNTSYVEPQPSCSLDYQSHIINDSDYYNHHQRVYNENMHMHNGYDYNAPSFPDHQEQSFQSQGFHFLNEVQMPPSSEDCDEYVTHDYNLNSSENFQPFRTSTPTFDRFGNSSSTSDGFIYNGNCDDTGGNFHSQKDKFSFCPVLAPKEYVINQINVVEEQVDSDTAFDTTDNQSEKFRDTEENSPKARHFERESKNPSCKREHNTSGYGNSDTDEDQVPCGVKKDIPKMSVRSSEGKWQDGNRIIQVRTLEGEVLLNSDHWRLANKVKNLLGGKNSVLSQSMFARERPIECKNILAEELLNLYTNPDDEHNS